MPVRSCPLSMTAGALHQKSTAPPALRSCAPGIGGQGTARTVKAEPQHENRHLPSDVHCASCTAPGIGGQRMARTVNLSIGLHLRLYHCVLVPLAMKGLGHSKRVKAEPEHDRKRQQHWMSTAPQALRSCAPGIWMVSCTAGGGEARPEHKQGTISIDRPLHLQRRIFAHATLEGSAQHACNTLPSPSIPYLRSLSTTATGR